MAAISPASAAAAPSSDISRRISINPSSRLFTSRPSLFFSRVWGADTSKPHRLHALQKRRILPRVKAKKQTFSSFDDLLETSSIPVLVDFYATWCGPCQFMVPILDEVSTRLNGKIRVVKIDTEKYPNIANRYEIQALPTFILFKDGKPCNRFEGAFPADELINQIECDIGTTK